MNDIKENVGRVLNAKNWTGLTLLELFEAGRLGSDPTEVVKQATHKLFPATTLGHLRRNRTIVEETVSALSATLATNTAK